MFSTNIRRHQRAATAVSSVYRHALAIALGLPPRRRRIGAAEPPAGVVAAAAQPCRRAASRCQPSPRLVRSARLARPHQTNQLTRQPRELRHGANLKISPCSSAACAGFHQPQAALALPRSPANAPARSHRDRPSAILQPGIRRRLANPAAHRNSRAARTSRRVLFSPRIQSQLSGYPQERDRYRHAALWQKRLVG